MTSMRREGIEATVDQLQRVTNLREHREYVRDMPELEIHFQHLSSPNLYHGGVRDIATVTGIPFSTVRKWRMKLLVDPSYRPYQHRNYHLRALTDEEEERVMSEMHRLFEVPGEICPPKAIQQIAMRVYQLRYTGETHPDHQMEEINQVIDFAAIDEIDVGQFNETDSDDIYIDDTLSSLRNFAATRQWRQGFFKRHGLSIQTPNANKTGEIDPTYLAYFTRTFWHIWNSIRPENIFNMDETSWAPTAFRQKTVARKGHRNPGRHFTHTDPKHHVTMIGSINAVGAPMPLILIAKGTTALCEEKYKRELANHAEKSHLLFTHSENGWVTADVAKNYLTFLREWASANGIQGDLFLLWDVFQAHKAKSVTEHAAALAIHLLLIPANGTNQYQPLDMAIFGELKRRALARLTDKHTKACLEQRLTSFKMVQTIECVLDSWRGISQENILSAWALLANKCSPAVT